MASMHDEHAIRERAYHLWEAAGRPPHRDHEFWEKAKRETDHAKHVEPAAKVNPDKATATKSGAKAAKSEEKPEASEKEKRTGKQTAPVPSRETDADTPKRGKKRAKG